MFTIGDLSKSTGVKVPTIRYYETIGLIEAAARSEGNQRRYTQAQVECLSFIKHARELGFTLEDIRELVALNHDHDKPCEGAHAIAAQHLKSVKVRLAKLRRLERELKRIDAMADDGKVGRCRVIQALAEHTLCETRH